VSGRAFPVDIVRHRRARRYVLRVTPDGRLRLTVPRGASIAGGYQFAERQAGWIERAWRRECERGLPWREGTVLWHRGERVQVVIADGRVALGPERLDRLDLARVDGDLRDAIEGHLKSVAAAELAARCTELARECGLTIGGVRVRSLRSRWGACSSRRAITLNWRLLQMPASVSDYVIFHELMHVKQPNHSARFWREVEAVCPGWRDAERWLRRFGRELI
jgi:predicted metal-dependent hydrolase